MRNSVCFYLLFGLIGCSGTFERMDAWMGVNQDAVTELLGAPDATGIESLGYWMRWKRTTDGVCTDRFTFENRKVVGYASDCGLWGSWTAPMAPSID